MTDDELITQIEAEESQSLGYFGSDLATERERAIEYYHGNLESVYKAPEGRSDIVSTDVRDAIDGMLPDLLDVFLSSDEVVKFEPQGPEDEPACKQATDACNYVFYKQNNGALILLEWFKSALLEKNGVVKFYHEKYATPQIEMYEGMNEPSFQALVNQEGVTVLAHSAYPDPMAPPGSGFSLHDVRVRVEDQSGKICVQGMPSEEFEICADHNSLSLRDVRYAAHRQILTVSDVRAMGIDVDPADMDMDDRTQYSPEWSARRRYNEERDYNQDNHTDPSLKKGVVKEISMLVDFDGDGYAERRKIIKIGKKAYFNDYADHVPFAAICPNIMPYRFIGRSVADDIVDIQLLKSSIWRGSIDSLSFSIRPQIGVMESMVNLDDVLVRRPGGVVRFKTNPSQAWAPLEHRFVGQAALPMLEYADQVKENRTGFTRYSQGLDADSLNKTATGVSLITAASAKRLKLIARMFAETGMKDLFRGIQGLIMKHKPEPWLVRLRNQFIPVDPRTWKKEWDMTVNVGLGTGDKAQQAGHLVQIMGVQKEYRMMGLGHLVSDKNMFNAAKRLQETSGFKQEGEFFTAPSPENPPPPPPPNPDIEKAKLQAQLDAEKIQSEERKKAAEIQNGQVIAKMQSDTTIAVAQINASTELEKEKLKAVNSQIIEDKRAQNSQVLEEKKAEHAEKIAKSKPQTQSQSKKE